MDRAPKDHDHFHGTKAYRFATERAFCCHMFIKMFVHATTIAGGRKALMHKISSKVSRFMPILGKVLARCCCLIIGKF